MPWFSGNIRQESRRNNVLICFLGLANLICLIGSVGLIITGSIILRSKNSVIHSVVPLLHYEAAAYILILVGVCLWIVFAGFFRRDKGKRHVLVCYFVCMGFCILLLVASAVLGLLANSDLDSKVRKWLDSSLPLYDHNEQVANTWDDLQSSYECCGIVGYTDWSEQFQWENLPGSCCRDPEEIGESSACKVWPSTDLFLEGCSNKINESVKKHKKKILVASLLGILALLCCVCIVCAKAKFS